MKIKFILIIIIVAILIGFFVGINLNTMKEKLTLIKRMFQCVILN